MAATGWRRQLGLAQNKEGITGQSMHVHFPFLWFSFDSSWAFARAAPDDNSVLFLPMPDRAAVSDGSAPVLSFWGTLDDTQVTKLFLSFELWTRDLICRPHRLPDMIFPPARNSDCLNRFGCFAFLGIANRAEEARVNEYTASLQAYGRHLDVVLGVQETSPHSCHACGVPPVR